MDKIRKNVNMNNICILIPMHNKNKAIGLFEKKSLKCDLGDCYCTWGIGNMKDQKYNFVPSNVTYELNFIWRSINKKITSDTCVIYMNEHLLIREQKK